MALPTNTLATYESVGNREDLSDIIYNVDPTETPFLTAAAKTKSTAVNHEWQTQALTAASTTNAVLEGDVATTDAAVATVRLGNICQISDKVAQVTGTQQQINKAGRGNELDYQMMLRAKELKRDMEAILLQRGAKASGSDTVARTLAGVNSWIKTNTDKGASGADPTGDGTNTRTDGTQRAFVESSLKNALQLAWTSGGDPDRIMLGGFNKQVMSTFTGRGTPMEDTKSKKIVASVDVYESDFGTLKVVPNRFMRARDVLILQMDMWGIAYLRNMKTVDLAKTGDSDQRQIICEYTLEARNEKANAGVYDVTTS